MLEGPKTAAVRAGHRQVTLRTAVGSLVLFLAFAGLARVYLVSNPPQRPGLWLLGSATCACASWWLLRARTAAAQQPPTR